MQVLMLALHRLATQTIPNKSPDSPFLRDLNSSVICVICVIDLVPFEGRARPHVRRNPCAACSYSE